MRNCLIFLGIYCLGINYCLAQRVTELERLKRSIPPKNQKFVLAKDDFKLQDTSVVSPNDYYLNAEYLCSLRCDTLFTFMRFYSDGRMFCSFLYKSPPGWLELKDTTYGKFGRYVITDGNLKVELYQDNHDGYAFMYAYPVPDGIQFYKSSSRGWLFRSSRRTKEGGHYQKYYF